VDHSRCSRSSPLWEKVHMAQFSVKIMRLTGSVLGANQHIRWPDGVVCPTCGSRSINTLPKRDLLQCRGCRKQFTPTSGTALRRSRLPVEMWFVATEAIIRWPAMNHADGSITLQTLGRILGIHTEPASRVKRIVMLDIKMTGEGLLHRAVCIKTLALPATILPGSYEHLKWVDAQAGHRFSPALT
jgi:hypothetical protein